ncbi:hypothetical protein ACFQDD_08060 [Halorubrum pallidum]|uniref:Uncharacterized protein n=1 Tax=Halorubrum pallidum TaxID=1526114 RepID=A0ABD5T1U4_9EURY
MSTDDNERTTAGRDAFLDSNGEVDAYRVRAMDLSIDWDTCAEIRRSLREGDAKSAAELARSDSEIDAARTTVLKHAQGRCGCPVDEPELTYSSTDGWTVAEPEPE